MTLQPVSLDVWRQKYQLCSMDGTVIEETPDDTFQRVAEALSRVEKPELRAEWYSKFLDVLRGGAVLGGRIMSNAGAEECKPKASLINCLAGDTPVLTRQGIRPIRELAGQTVEILNGDGEWVFAPFRSFGMQKVYRTVWRWARNKGIKLTVKATAEHRWHLVSGRVITTEYWLSGPLMREEVRKVPHVFPPLEKVDPEEYNQGIIHGMIYGDGTQYATHAVLNLCKDKRALTPLVAGILGVEPSHRVTNGCEVACFYLPASYPTRDHKDLPTTASLSYIRGFFAGLLATDGSVSPNAKGCQVSVYGQKTLVDFLSETLPLLGMGVTYSKKMSEKGTRTNYGVRNKDVWMLCVHPATMDPKDVLRPEHKAVFKVTADGLRSTRRWTLESVDPTPSMEEVFCCSEPKTTAFTLAGGMKTGQCVVSGEIHDSIVGIFETLKDAAITLATGAGIGYCCSSLRPKGAHINGVGAKTSGPLPFMAVYDAMCATISSAGGRRGAQMLTMHVWHPDIEAFIKKKREDGQFRQFNMSVLITDEFMEAVEANEDWDLAFPMSRWEAAQKVKWIDWPFSITPDYVSDCGLVKCKVYKTVKARALWDLIMRSTYDYSEPGVMFIDRINRENNNLFCEKISSTNPCGEVPLYDHGACLLGSLNLSRFVRKPFAQDAHFDIVAFKDAITVFTRMLDNVVEINGLPLEQQRKEITEKRRHGMGYFGLGTALAMLRLRYGSDGALIFTEMLTATLAEVSWQTGVELADEKGPAPIMEKSFTVTPELMGLYPDLADANVRVGESVPGRVLLAYSPFMRRLAERNPALVGAIAQRGARFTHALALAPTGTISLSFGNNASNGIEPSFAHEYIRNIIVEGKKTKEAVTVYSAEALLWKEMHGDTPYPDYFVTADTITPKEHVDMLCAAQKWIDQSISKTTNCPTDLPFEEFKDLYRYAYECGAKGCTTFRYNPERFQGVLVRDDDLKATTYRFTLADGSSVDVAGNEVIEYDGETHTAANLFDAIKEGLYGTF